MSSIYITAIKNKEGTKQFNTLQTLDKKVFVTRQHSFKKSLEKLSFLKSSPE